MARPDLQLPELDRFRERPLRPFEVFTSTSQVADVVSVARRTIETGWSWSTCDPVPLTPPIPWEESAEVNRSWSFHIHSWDQLVSVLAAYDQTQDAEFLAAALETALDWTTRYDALTARSAFAWYDMAVGLRAQRLAYLFDAYVRTEARHDEVLSLWRSLQHHVEILADPDEFKSKSNHGLYQAAGLTAVIHRLPEIDPDGALGRRASQMVDAMIDQQFADDGTHLEHSPDYHRMVLGTIIGMREAGLLDSNRIDELIEVSDESLAWFIMPNGFLPTIGDSDSRRLGPGTYASLGDQKRRAISGHPWRSPHGRWVASGGTDGEPPKALVRGFEKGGYLVVRSEDTGSYLAMQAGFHSRAHKHADDLAITWMERGQEVLVDGGRYGYLGKGPAPGSPASAAGFWYGDERRQYVESTHAHCTIEIDGRLHDRVGRVPFGSALSGWGENGEIAYGAGQVEHGSVVHHRTAVTHPGQWLLVVDRLEDRSGQPHRYVANYLLHPDVGLEVAGDTWIAGLRLADGTKIGVTQLGHDAAQLTPVRGSDPPYRGWYSESGGRFDPTWWLGWEARGSTATFATLFAVDGMVVVGADGFIDGGDWAEFRWNSGSGSTHVRVDWGIEGLVVESTHDSAPHGYRTISDERRGIDRAAARWYAGDRRDARSVLALGTSFRSSHPWTWIWAARIASSDGRYGDGLRLARQALGLAPSSQDALEIARSCEAMIIAETLDRLAEVRTENRFDEVGNDVWRAAVDLGSTEQIESALLEEGVSRWHSGDEAGAGIFFRCATEQFGSHPWAWVWLSRYEAVHGDRYRALVAARRAVAIAPELPAALHARAKVQREITPAMVDEASRLLEGGDPRGAAQLLRSVVDDANENAWACIWLSRAQAALGETDAAVRSAEAAVTIDSGLLAAQRQLAAALADGSPTERTRACEIAMAVVSEHGRAELAWCARLLIKLHDVDSLRSLSARWPDNPELAEGRALVALNEGDADRAESELEFLGRDPASLVARAEFWLAHQDPARADELLRRLPEESVPVETARLAALSWDTFGVEEYFDSALAAYERALRLDPAWDAGRDALQQLEGELAVLSGSAQRTIAIEPRPVAPRSGSVLHVVGKSLPEYTAGYSVRTHEIARSQLTEGIDASVVTRAGFPAELGASGEPLEIVDGVAYHRLAPPDSGRGTADEVLRATADRLADLVAETKPAILHAHSDFLNLDAAGPVGSATDLPVVYEVRGFWEETWLANNPTSSPRHDRYRMRRERELEAMQRADHVITLAEVMKAHIAELGIDPEKVSVIPNAVDPAVFPVVERSDRVISELGIPDGALTVGTITSLAGYEGIDDLLRALHALGDRSIYCIIVGDGAEKGNLESLSAELEIERLVRFVGRVPYENVLDYYGAIDVLVIPRKDLSVTRLVQPLKPFEAMSTGRCVVLSDTPPMAEIHDRSQSVLLTPPDDPAALAALIESLDHDRERMRGLGRQAASWVRANATWEVNARRYRAVYERLGVFS